MGNSLRGLEEMSDFPDHQFRFHESFQDETDNGLYFNDIFVPEEILIMILSRVPVRQILKTSLVCKKWCNIIKSGSFWYKMYHSKCKKKAKKLPWYLYYCYLTTNYFDNNLIRNGNGQEGFRHWVIVKNYGDEFKIEKTPVGCDPLPLNVTDFCGKTSCFVTSFFECNKRQEINFENSQLMCFILYHYRPHIYASEWVASRFDCGGTYSLQCKLYGTTNADWEQEEDERRIFLDRVEKYLNPGTDWTKVELLLQGYPEGVVQIVFQHEGKDTQFWKGHYGTKMAGAVLKILFDSIEPLPESVALE